ncbi:hypothetical protein TcG_13006 [Trypanosoma cruzi]|nr:hypothetical protein TcG_13006 [Trypanosoma cruzi]
MRRGLCDGQAFLPAAEAEHRRRPNSTAAQPIPVSGKLAPPCLGASQDTKLLCTDLQQHGETTAEGMIAVLPLAGNFSSGQAAAATHSACYIPSVQIHVGISRLPLVRCIGAFPTMWSQRPETFRTRRGASIPVSCTQGKGSIFPSWQQACLSRDAVLRPRSVGWQMVIRVHVNKWTSSGRHAVRVAQSHREQDATAADPRCLCRVFGQLRVHADWGGGEILSCRR